MEHLYIGASPDVFVVCDCCGKGCVEVKCSYCHKPDEEQKEFFVKKNEEGIASYKM